MDNVNNNMLKNLSEMRIEVGSVNAKVLNYLNKIEAILFPAFEEQSRLVTLLKNIKLSMLQISSDAGIARQTLYNNPLLKQYIEKRIDDYHQINPYKRIEHLSIRMSQLQDDVHMMRRRDVNEELQKKRISDLEEELTIKNKEIRSLIERIRVANERNSHQENPQAHKQKGNILNISYSQKE